MGVINIEIVFKVRIFDEIFKGVSVDREKRKFKDWFCLEVEGNEKICSKEIKKDRLSW